MNRAIPGAVSGAIVTLIGVIVAFSLQAKDTDMREYQKKLDDKASKAELKEAIEVHEKTDAARYQGIQDMFIITNDRLKEIQQDIRQMREIK